MGIKINISYKTFSHYSLSESHFCFTCAILCNKLDDDDDEQTRIDVTIRLLLTKIRPCSGKIGGKEYWRPSELVQRPTCEPKRQGSKN